MLTFYGHPLSSYCWKALIALYEKGAPFRFEVLSPDNAEAGATFAANWPLQRMPLLRDGDRWLRESSIIIEHLDLTLPQEPRLIPRDPAAALDIRFLDRVFDNYVMTPMQAIVFNRIRPPEHRDGYGDEKARDLLRRSYGWLEGSGLVGPWAAGEVFSLADCAAAPALFYADKVEPFGSEHPRLRAYLDRLQARPSFARVLEEKQPYWHFFPQG